MISKNHSGRAAHNWLAFDISDRMLEKHEDMYTGVLYDLGAGESPYRDYFLQHADQYVAVDWSGESEGTTIDIVADLNEPLTIESECADSVVSLSVLEHLCEPQVMLNEAFRILKPGGPILLQVPWQWWIHSEPYDYYRYTPYGLAYLMERAGFADVIVEPQAGFFTTIVLKMNYFTKRFVRGRRPVRMLLYGLFSVFWYLGQRLAPLFDKLDDRWTHETSGYFVTARKPAATTETPDAS